MNLGENTPPIPGSTPESVPMGRILALHDEGRAHTPLTLALNRAGYGIDFSYSLLEAIDRIRSLQPDLVLIDSKQERRRCPGIFSELRTAADNRLLPIIALFEEEVQDEHLHALELGLTEMMTKPVPVFEVLLRAQSLVRLKCIAKDLDPSEAIIITFAKMVDNRSPYTARHSARVAHYAGLLAERIGLPDRHCRAVRQGCLFHDIGKIAVRDLIVHKPSELTPLEYEEMKRHPKYGRDLLQHLRAVTYAIPVVYHHHEHYDGSGYPDGLAGDAIPIAARVTAIADVFDALTAPRNYRQPLSQADALDLMTREARIGLWDPRLLNEFLGALQWDSPMQAASR
ncbi:MAG: HD domain-containing protein [Nitrospirae bacterium]|nr:HD domain-containing protein [Nitrospirota bacterium]